MDIKTNCRICLRETKSTVCLVEEQFFHGRDYLSFCQVFNFCTQLSASIGDHLTQHLCVICVTKLEKCYELIKLAQYSDGVLSGYTVAEDGTSKMKAEDEVQTSMKDCGVEILEEDEFPELLPENIEFENVEDSQSVFFDDELVENCMSSTKQPKPKDKAAEESEQCNNKDDLDANNPYEEIAGIIDTYLCSECPLIFKSIGNLNRHIKIHNKKQENKFKCEICQKGFYYKSYYEMHYASHTNQRLPCEQCGKFFKHKVSLAAHLKWHQGGDYECPECNKKFINSTFLEMHKKFHSKEYAFECNLCSKRFQCKSHLKDHKFTHLGIKYKCTICHKIFSRKTGFNEHRFSHTGMPYPCNLCSKGFPTKNKLRNHFVKSHKFDPKESDLKRKVLEISEDSNICVEVRECEMETANGTEIALVELNRDELRELKASMKDEDSS